MIYLDNSATTKPNAACVQAMTRLLCDTWGRLGPATHFS